MVIPLIGGVVACYLIVCVDDFLGLALLRGFHFFYSPISGNLVMLVA